MLQGFYRIAAGVPRVKVADPQTNAAEVLRLVHMARKNGCAALVLPELALTGYTCGDLFEQRVLLQAAEEALGKVLAGIQNSTMVVIVGLPVRVQSRLFNVAAVLQNGRILGLAGKTYLPNYGEFYEKRWFASVRDLNPTTIYLAGSPVEISAEPIVIRTNDGVGLGIEICEDVWAPVPPSNNLTMAGADIILNLSASDELIGKHKYLRWQFLPLE